ncbi:c-type cytochrome [Pandoraea pneumonica]|uniref:c-type cytochrome n=1 Tax=Pandoraea pneumonica TaxID=2508299 RepID=UPI003CE80092
MNARQIAPLGAMLMALAFASPVFAQGNIAEGKTLFTARCSSCHTVGPMAGSGFGPQLNAISGRRAGSLKDFEYSSAMKQSGIVWDDKSLAAFIENPGKAVPGTKMRFWGISNPRKIADLLAYLNTLK